VLEKRLVACKAGLESVLDVVVSSRRAGEPRAAAAAVEADGAVPVAAAA
jgi:hypothetical protein